MCPLYHIAFVVYIMLLASSCLASDHIPLATRLDSESDCEKYASSAAVVVFAVFAACVFVAVAIGSFVLLRRRQVSTNRPSSKRISLVTYLPSALTTMTEFKPSRRPSEETFVVGSLEGFHSYLSGKDLDKGSARSVNSAAKVDPIPMSSSWESDSTFFVDVDLEKLSFVAEIGHLSQGNSSDPPSNRTSSCYSVASSFPQTPNSFLNIPETPLPRSARPNSFDALLIGLQTSLRTNATAGELALPVYTNDRLPHVPPQARLSLAGNLRLSHTGVISELPRL